MKFTWPESARSELCGVDRESTMRVLIALTRYGESGEGDNFPPDRPRIIEGADIL